MSPKQIANGVVHKVPDDVCLMLGADAAALEFWQGLTALGRNEWLCWVADAKKPETRQRRLGRLQNEIKAGKRRPCCWPGCCHREKTGKSA